MLKETHVHVLLCHATFHLCVFESSQICFACVGTRIPALIHATMAGLNNVWAFTGFLRKVLIAVAKEVDKHEERLSALQLAEICQDTEPSKFCK